MLRTSEQFTSWADVNAAYESAVTEFVGGLYAGEDFVGDLEAFVKRLVVPGRVNALSQLLLTFLLGDDWGDTVVELPAGRWKNEYTGVLTEGGGQQIQTLFGNFPIALLTKVS